MIMESTDSSTGSQQPQLPPGFRFHPTDEELVVHYLKKKATSAPLPVSIIAEVDLYKFDPWELPAKAIFGEQEWYFFSPRDRKYPNGARPNRAATSGYWKATGTDKPVLTAGGTQKVGVKKALVFYGGKPPKGIKTNWIMHEYRLTDNKPNTKPPGCDIAKKGSLRLDDWVLCRIYKKTNAQRPIDQEREDMNEMMNSINSGTMQMNSIPGTMGLKPYTGSLMDNEQVLYEGLMSHDPMNSHLAAASSKLPLMGPVVPNLLQGKRTLPNLYWNDQGSPPTKRFFEDGRSSDDNTNSMVSLLSHLPQTSSVQQQQAMLGSLGDGVFRQPNQNHQQNHQQQYWYT